MQLSQLCRMRLKQWFNRSCLGAGLLLVIVSNAGCEALQGVNVGTGVNLPGGIGVGANKTIGSGSGNERAEKKSAKKSAAGPLKLYVFDCGTLRLADVSAFGLSNDETKQRELFVPCYLIEHPSKGRLIWDGGLPLGLVGQGEVVSDTGLVQEYKRSLLSQLADLNLHPRDIDYIAFSHMHFDHVGSANAFIDSTLLIQQAEYNAAFVNVADYFDAELYKNLRNNPVDMLNGDHDVFGDGSVQIISAPGHTPGHQVLLVRLQNRGPVLLSGDLYHFNESRQLRRVPTFNADKDITLNSMDKIESIINATQAALWIEHSMPLARTLKLAPNYYD